jgi:hypothetical protein
MPLPLRQRERRQDQRRDEGRPTCGGSEAVEHPGNPFKIRAGSAQDGFKGNGEPVRAVV